MNQPIHRSANRLQRMFDLLSDLQTPEKWYDHRRQVMADLSAHPEIEKRFQVPPQVVALLIAPPQAVRDTAWARAAVNFLNPDILRSVQKEWGDDKSFSQFLGKEYERLLGADGQMDAQAVVRYYRMSIERMGRSIIEGQDLFPSTA